jgi:YHS domain-containing protein
VAVRRLLAEHQAQEVKTIGDALMLRAGDAAAAIQLGLRIVHDVGAQHGFPQVRVGMHTGPAVERGGDWFGATVNLAARLAAAAAGGQALLTAATRAACGDVEGVELRERGRWAFRNVGEPVAVYAAVREGARSSAGLPIDPVCRMAVDPWHSAGRLTHQGVEYCFCSLGCAGAFASTPAGTQLPATGWIQPLTDPHPRQGEAHRSTGVDAVPQAVHVQAVALLGVAIAHMEIEPLARPGPDHRPWHPP